MICCVNARYEARKLKEESYMKNIGFMQGRLTNKGGFYPQIFPKGKWKDEFNCAEKIGFSCMEWMLNANEYEVNPIMTEEGIIQIKEQIEKTGIYVSAICANYFMMNSLYDITYEQQEKNLEILKILIKNASKLSCRKIILPMFEASEMEIENTILRNLLKGILSEAQKAGVDILLESNIKTEELVSYIQTFNAENIGICYDIGNATGMGMDVIEDIEKYVRFIHNIHIKDKKDGQSVMLGQGEAPFRECLKQLNKNGYSGEYVLESYYDEDAIYDTTKNFQYIKEHMILKVLFIGLGSAGQRHLRNLIKLKGENIEILAYRARGLSRVYDNQLHVIPDKTLDDVYSIHSFSNLEDALQERPDIAIIANPNNLHVEFALKIAETGCHIFMEKPLSVNEENIDVLKKTVKEKNIKLYVGYQNRLHPCIKRAKQLLETKQLGKIISVNCEVGELLSSMHKYEDYRTMNESQKKNGGGVVLCQIHELDYLYWLFGLPEELYAIGGKDSYLEIDVEDNATALCKCRKDDKAFSLVIHQDFLQYPPNRKCKIIGENGYLEINLLKNICNIYIQGKENEMNEFLGFERNDMFLEEMSLFLESVETGKKEFVNIDDAYGSLKWALAIKESMENGIVVKIGKEFED